MRVAALITLLQAYAVKHGQDAQIYVPSDKLEHVGKYGATCREDIYIASGNISTVLTSRGDEVIW